ncbi:hypothetical protein Acr_26g0007710 [Actinidia rufa]|uniref:Uncharacterized protein n=1 Tax=Actinidia rufa TaxID=165716 RepID=A0A7J0H3C2_9ERIC|nr:hypothetical protein Acr_26g0007710 [Actinidia rufa]
MGLAFVCFPTLSELWFFGFMELRFQIDFKIGVQVWSWSCFPWYFFVVLVTVFSLAAKIFGRSGFNRVRLAVARQASGCSEELLRALDLDLGRSDVLHQASPWLTKPTSSLSALGCSLIAAEPFFFISDDTPIACSEFFFSDDTLVACSETASIHVPSLKEAFAIIQNEESRNGVMLPPIASKQSALISIPQFDDLVTLGRLAGVSIVDLLLENEGGRSRSAGGHGGNSCAHHFTGVEPSLSSLSLWPYLTLRLSCFAASYHD